MPVSSGGSYSCGYYDDDPTSTVECAEPSDSNGELRFEVWRHPANDNDAGGLANEGFFDAPLDVTGELPRVSTLYYGPSFYVVRGLGSRPYTVEISSDDICLGATVYADATQETALCSISTCANATCEATPVGGALYILVSGSPLAPEQVFTLDVR